MKWGIFSLSRILDQAQHVAAFEADLRQFELTEALGSMRLAIERMIPQV